MMRYSGTRVCRMFRYAFMAPQRHATQRAAPPPLRCGYPARCAAARRARSRLPRRRNGLGAKRAAVLQRARFTRWSRHRARPRQTSAGSSHRVRPSSRRHRRQRRWRASTPPPGASSSWCFGRCCSSRRRRTRWRVPEFARAAGSSIAPSWRCCARKRWWLHLTWRPRSAPRRRPSSRLSRQSTT